ncbi:MAG: DUF1566 domain-containing protein, partial [Polyangiaceae bacterium]|nr:DUF1566 domain-containing protein [Polyangiaceae bacterium]
MLDKDTNLTWQRQVDANIYNQIEADAYCMALNTNGGGWRLPTISELLTLVDETGYSPAIDTTAFPNTP